MQYDTICLSGGGMKNICFLGALKELEENKLIDLKLITKYVGSSAGSIIAFLLSINYSINELIEFIYKFDFNKLEPNIDCSNLFELFGIDNGQKIMTLLKMLLKNKIPKEDLTFGELFKITKKKLLIITTNYSESREDIFSLETTQHFSILKSIRMSIAIPFIFTPVKYNNNIYIDGGIVNNFAINHCNPDTTIGLCILVDNNKEIKSITEYILGLLTISTTFISLKHKMNKDNIIFFKSNDKSLLNLEFNLETKKLYIEMGQNTIKNFYNSKYKLFIKIIINDIINSI